MSEPVPDLLARRIRQEHTITGPATMDQLLAVCEARNCPVVWIDYLVGRGYYVVDERAPPFILLRTDASPYVLAHELYHHLVHDNAQYGVVYSFPDCEVDADPNGNRPANEFAHLLCSPEE